MLDNVKQTIAKLADNTFDEHFVNYIMNMQDISIQAECKSLIRRNPVLTTVGMVSVINNICEGMKVDGK